jgi:hypothetical protein
MKNFILGFTSATFIFILVIAGLYIDLEAEAERQLDDPETERKSTELQLIIRPTEDLDLSEAIGLNALELASFLEQKNENRMGELLNIFMSGANVTIISEFDAGEAPRTQTIFFRNGKIENRIHSITTQTEIHSTTKVELLRDPNPQIENEFNKFNEYIEKQIRILNDPNTLAKEQMQSAEAPINQRPEPVR